MIKDDKTLGYIVIAIIAYNVLQAMLPMLIFGLIGMVALRMYQQHSGRR